MPAIARRTPIPRSTITGAGVPAFADLLLDEPRGRLYGTDRAGGRALVLGLPQLVVVAAIDVGEAAEPVGLALSPDGAELAVALFRAGNVALIDLSTLQVSGKLYPLADRDGGTPLQAVRYVKPGLLYALGGAWAGGPLHAFDTVTRAELGHSRDTFIERPRVAMADDGSLLVSDGFGSDNRLFRYAPAAGVPTLVASNRQEVVKAPDIAVRRDGTAVYTAGGQVWARDLQTQIGLFAAQGTCIAYVPQTERLYLCQPQGIIEVEATGSHAILATYATAAEARVARANAAGTAIYVSTDAGIAVIHPGAQALAPPLPVPTKTPTLGILSTSTAVPIPTASLTARLTTVGSAPELYDIALDERRNRLYGTDKAAGKLLIFDLATLSLLAAIDFGQTSDPTGITMRPDGGEIAVALTGTGFVALINPENLTIAGRLRPQEIGGRSTPQEVRYLPSGRLVATGSEDGVTYFHLFDTQGQVEVGSASDPKVVPVRFAIAADGSIFYSSQLEFGSARLRGDDRVPLIFDRLIAQRAPDVAVRQDKSALYLANGQVWSRDLTMQLGAFNADGSRIEYVAATERLYICQERAIIEVEATGNYNVSARYEVSTTARIARANASGTLLYVSTEEGIVVIPLGAAPVPPASPKP